VTAEELEAVLPMWLCRCRERYVLQEPTLFMVGTLGMPL